MGFASGFMQGLGTSFSKSFENQRERSERRQDDLFKMTYDNFLKRKKENWDDPMKADTLAVNKAKSLAEMYNQPKESVGKIYEWITSGVDDSTINERLEKGKFSVTQRGSEAVVSDEPIRLTPVSVDEQMAQMSPISAPAAPASIPGQRSPGGGLFSKIPSPDFRRDGFNPNINEVNAGKAQDRVAQITGGTREDVNRTLTERYTPKGVSTPKGIDVIYRSSPEVKANLDEAMVELAQAQSAVQKEGTPEAQERFRVANERVEALKKSAFIKANADALSQGTILPGQQAKIITPEGDTEYGYASLGPKGEIMFNGEAVPQGSEVRGVSPEEQKAYSELASKLAKPQADYNSKLGAMASVVREAGDLGKIVDTIGTVPGKATEIAGWATDLGAEVMTGVELLKSLRNNNRLPTGTRDEVFKIENMEQKLNEIFGSQVLDASTAQMLYNAKVQILAYKLAMIEGQSGRGLSEIERELFVDLASSGSTPQKFNQNMANIIFSRINDLANEASIFNQNSVEQEAFTNRFNWKKPPFSPAQDPEEFILSNPKLKEAYDRYLPFNNMSLRAQPPRARVPEQQSAPQGGTPEGFTPIGITPDGRTIFRTPDGRQVVGK